MKIVSLEEFLEMDKGEIDLNTLMAKLSVFHSHQ